MPEVFGWLDFPLDQFGLICLLSRKVATVGRVPRAIVISHPNNLYCNQATHFALIFFKPFTTKPALPAFRLASRQLEFQVRTAILADEMMFTERDSRNDKAPDCSGSDPGWPIQRPVDSSPLRSSLWWQKPEG